LRQGKRLGFKEDLFYDLIIWGVPAGIIGARLYYVIFEWKAFASNPIRALYIWEGGLAIHGGLIAAIIVGILIARRYKVNFWDIADIAGPSIIIAQAIGRWGNFVNQEAYGYETNLPWAMYIDGAYRHPTFLYESLWDLLVFCFLLWLRRQKFIRSGEIFLSYLALYSVGRFFIEGLRTDSLMLGSIRVAQLVSASLIVFVIVFGLIRRKYAKNTAPMLLEHSKAVAKGRK
jgi:phosphatidylglycerol:prolipoprotein diacylglycerol transferase